MAPEITWTLKAYDGETLTGLRLADLKQMAAAGTVGGLDQIINEQSGDAYEAGMVDDLGMVWQISLEEEEWSPPFHPLALVEPMTTGDLDPDTLLRHVETGDEFAVSEVVCAVLIEQNKLLQDILEETTSSMEAASRQLQDLEPARPDEPAIDVESNSDEPPSPGEWQRLMKDKDALEKDVIKWRKFYEDEVERNAVKEASLARRVDEFHSQQQQLEARYNLLRESKEQLEEENDRFKASLREGVGSQGDAISIQEISRSSKALESQMKLLESQLDDRNRLIQDLYGERDEMEKETEERVARVENSMRREREESGRLRLQIIELEHKHKELLKAYREINDRLIQMRNLGSAPRTAHPEAPDAAASPSPAPAKTDTGGKARIKMR